MSHTGDYRLLSSDNLNGVTFEAVAGDAGRQFEVMDNLKQLGVFQDLHQAYHGIYTASVVMTAMGLSTNAVATGIFCSSRISPSRWFPMAITMTIVTGRHGPP